MMAQYLGIDTIDSIGSIICLAILEVQAIPHTGSDHKRHGRGPEKRHLDVSLTWGRRVLTMYLVAVLVNQI